MRGDRPTTTRTVINFDPGEWLNGVLQIIIAECSGVVKQQIGALRVFVVGQRGHNVW